MAAKELRDAYAPLQVPESALAAFCAQLRSAGKLQAVNGREAVNGGEAALRCWFVKEEAERVTRQTKGAAERLLRQELGDGLQLARR